jgi:hypothetical protein
MIWDEGKAEEEAGEQKKGGEKMRRIEEDEGDETESGFITLLIYIYIYILEGELKIHSFHPVRQLVVQIWLPKDVWVVPSGRLTASQRTLVESISVAQY